MIADGISPIPGTFSRATDNLFYHQGAGQSSVIFYRLFLQGIKREKGPVCSETGGCHCWRWTAICAILGDLSIWDVYYSDGIIVCQRNDS